MKSRDFITHNDTLQSQQRTALLTHCTHNSITLHSQHTTLSNNTLQSQQQHTALSTTHCVAQSASSLQCSDGNRATQFWIPAADADARAPSLLHLLSSLRLSSSPQLTCLPRPSLPHLTPPSPQNLWASRGAAPHPSQPTNLRSQIGLICLNVGCRWSFFC